MREISAQERYEVFRENVELSIESNKRMVEMLEREGKTEQAIQLTVWAVRPLENLIRDDDCGELWPRCASCGEFIKNDDDIAQVEGETGCTKCFLAND
jgi:formylmethanofuran dehydrogenase subunit E